MESPPANPFSSSSGGGGGVDDNHRFDAFQLSPDKNTTAGAAGGASNNTRLPSLQSIQAAQQQQQQQQQQRSSLQFDSSSNLPPPEELKGPMNNQGGGGNISGTPSSSSWPPPSSSTLNPPQPTNNNNNNNNSNNHQSSSSILPKFLTCNGILTINSLSPYFDIDTSDIVLRLKSSIRYCNVMGGFRNEVLYSDNAAILSARSSAAGGGSGGGENSGGDTGGDSTIGNTTPGGGGGGKGPDLYGPTWITMTLVFFLAVTSNMSLYFHHTNKNKSSIMDEVDEGGMAAEEEWDYDINQLLHATWILYSFSFLLPMVLYLIFRLMNVISFSIVDLICLYGYSLVPYLPSTWICTFPVSWLQWLVLCVSTVISGLLVLRNVTGPIMESSVGGGGGGGMGGQGKSGGLIMAVIGCHFIFFLVLKLGFYHHA